jgi:hypothetical protein
LEKSKERKLKMKKVLLGVISLLLVIGLFAAVGYTAYRVGYNQGAQATVSGDTSPLGPFGGFGPRGMPMRDFGRDVERGFHRGFGPGGFPIMGFGFFPLLLFIVVLGFIIGFIYWLLTRNGWRFTRTPQATVTTPTNTEGGNQNAEANQ